jgi:hypothetical protein
MYALVAGGRKSSDSAADTLLSAEYQLATVFGLIGSASSSLHCLNFSLGYVLGLNECILTSPIRVSSAAMLGFDGLGEVSRSNVIRPRSPAQVTIQNIYLFLSLIIMLSSF